MPDPQTTPLPFQLPWVAAPDYGNNQLWYVACLFQTEKFPSFTIMAQGLVESMARHIVKLHNEALNV